jgi:DNA repair exonuclease SbcCD nuclease subunit
VHSSDLHVDDDYTARAYGAAALGCVLDAAREAGAEIVVLAGDVFEYNRLPLAPIERSARLLGDAAMMIGNHDPATADSVYRRGGFAYLPNVRVLGVTDDDAVLLPRLDLEIWGHAHRDYVDMALLREPRRRRSRRQIAVAHGHYESAPDRATRLRPSWLIDAAEIAETGADYVALGHWNRAAAVGDGQRAGLLLGFDRSGGNGQIRAADRRRPGAGDAREGAPDGAGIARSASRRRPIPCR